MAIINIVKENFEKEVLQSDQRVLIDFWASWCGPCQMLAPILEEVSQEIPEIKICKINVDKEPELASRFGVINIPMLVVMEEGKMVNQSIGFVMKQQVVELLQE